MADDLGSAATTRSFRTVIFGETVLNLLLLENALDTAYFGFAGVGFRIAYKPMSHMAQVALGLGSRRWDRMEKFSVR